MVKSALHGNQDPAFAARLQKETQFFWHVSYTAVPGTQVLPRMPVKLCKIQGQIYYGLPGPAHSAKNSASQLCSEATVLFFGHFMADPSGSLEFDMPLPAYCRKDSMADRLTSLVSCPLVMACIKVSQLTGFGKVG